MLELQRRYLLNEGSNRTWCSCDMLFIQQDVSGLTDCTSVMIGSIYFHSIVFQIAEIQNCKMRAQNNISEVVRMNSTTGHGSGLGAIGALGALGSFGAISFA